MALPSSPGATARALAASNTSNAPMGGFLAGLGRLGLQPSPAHYTAQGVIEGQVDSGQITAEQAARLKGRDITERGFNPILGFAGAIPYQLFDEAFDPESAGQRSLSDALSQGWQNIRGVADVVGERIQDNPWGALSAIFSSQKTPGGGFTGAIPRALEGIFPGATPTTLLPEQPSPRGFGYQAAFSRDPAFDVNERSMASITPAGETGVRYVPGGRIVNGRLILDPPKELPPVETTGEWQARQESEAKAAVEADRTATIEALYGGRTYGGRTESGIGIADREPLGPWPKYLTNQNQLPAPMYNQDVLSAALEEAQGNLTSPGGTLAEDRAKYGNIKAFNATMGENMPRTEEDRHDVREHLDIVFGNWKPESMGGEPTDPADPNILNLDGLRPSLGRQGKNILVRLATDLGKLLPVDGPVGTGKRYSIQDLVLEESDNEDVVNALVSDYQDAEDAEEDDKDYDGPDKKIFSTAISESLKDLINNEVFKDIRDSEALTGLDKSTKMDMAYQNPNVVWDERQMDALAELIAIEKKDIEDVLANDMVELKTQVESFAAMPPPKPAPRRVQYTPPKKETAKRQPSQRAPKRTAVKKAVAPKPKPQAKRQAAATAKRKKAQATARAAASQRQAAQQREQAARAKEAAARAQQQSRAQAAAAAARAREQAAARARNKAAEDRLRSTMGGTNYAAYLRRGK